MSTVNSENESDSEAFEPPSKSNARRRVDAYHEAMRERAALRELEQPFVTDIRAWPPPRF